MSRAEHKVSKSTRTGARTPAGSVPTTPTATPRRRVFSALVPAVLGLALAALLAGCGAGQITQTSSLRSDANGANGMAGAIALRDAELAYPASTNGVYQPGSDAPLLATIVNTGGLTDELVRVSSPAAGGVTIDGSSTGSKTVPGGFAVQSGTVQSGQSSSGSASPTETAASGSTASSPASSPASSSSPTSSSAGAGELPGGVGGSSPSPSAGVLPVGKVQIVLTGLKSINGLPLRVGMTIPVTFTFAHGGQVTLDVPVADPPANSGAGNG